MLLFPYVISNSICLKRSCLDKVHERVVRPMPYSIVLFFFFRATDKRKESYMLSGSPGGPCEL